MKPIYDTIFHNYMRKYMTTRRYMRIYKITDEELDGLESIDEKYEYCLLIMIKEKYGIDVSQINDETSSISSAYSAFIDNYTD